MKSRSLYGEREAIKHVRVVVRVLKAQVIARKLHSHSEKRGYPVGKKGEYSLFAF